MLQSETETNHSLAERDRNKSQSCRARPQQITVLQSGTETNHSLAERDPNKSQPPTLKGFMEVSNLGNAKDLLPSFGFQLVGISASMFDVLMQLVTFYNFLRPCVCRPPTSKKRILRKPCTSPAETKESLQPKLAEALVIRAPRRTPTKHRKDPPRHKWQKQQKKQISA